MEKLQQMALLSVGRAVAFGGLAIFTIMVAFSFDPVLALKIGGTLLLVQLSILLLKAQAPARNFRHTETWLLLDKEHRPDERFAGLLIANAVRDACLFFARWTAGLAVVIWMAAVLLSFFIGPDADGPTLVLRPLRSNALP